MHPPKYVLGFSPDHPLKEKNKHKNIHKVKGTQTSLMSTHPIVIQKGRDILVQVGGVYQLSVYGIYTPKGYSNELQWDMSCGANSM